MHGYINTQLKSYEFLHIRKCIFLGFATTYLSDNRMILFHYLRKTTLENCIIQAFLGVIFLSAMCGYCYIPNLRIVENFRRFVSFNGTVERKRTVLFMLKNHPFHLKGTVALK